MTVIIAKHSGFCVGVKRAVDTANSIYGKNVYILGDIIHNETVLKEIANKGTTTVYNVSDVPDNSTCIIRSHGVGKNVIKSLEDRGVTVLNRTCPFVMKTQKIVEQYYSNGYLIVIVGKPTHPEVEGLNGWCNGSAVIIDGLNVPEEVFKAEKVCVVSQTTYSVEKFKEILKKIHQNCLKTVEVFETICYTTMERQIEAHTLSKKCDAMVVLGGKSSSNTAKLYEICSSNCKNTFFVSSPDGLDYKILKRYKSVGVVSGASTPLKQSMEVLLTMEEKEMTMEEAVALLDEKQNLKKGQKISVVISQVNDDGLKVYFDGKKDIDLPKEELSTENYNKADYNVGDEIEVVVIARKPAVVLSQKQIQILKEEEALVAELSEGKVFNFTVDSKNKGGVVGKYGNFNVFVPAGEIKIGYVKDLDKYVGKTLRVKALKVEYNAKKKEVVASQKVILVEEKAARDAEKAAKEEAFFASIAENDVVEGTVARFASFGAFVVVNGFDCLAHVSDLSWTGVKDPASVLEIGKSYDFVVLKVEKDAKKVSIGYKQLQPKPWETVTEKYNVGDTVEGKVVRLVNFGAFVEVEKGIDGLVHVSQISHEYLENPASVLKVGQDVTAKILAIDVEKEKMTLSIKALVEAPVKEDKKETEDKPKRERKAKKVEDPDNMRGWTESADAGISIAELLNK